MYVIIFKGQWQGGFKKNTQDASGKLRFIRIPTKNVRILLVTVAGRGGKSNVLFDSPNHGNP